MPKRGELTKLFKEHLSAAVREGCDNTRIDRLAGCTDRKIVLTEAEGEAGKRLFSQLMAERLWDLSDNGAGGWLFGSPNTMLNIGLVPSRLASERLGLNRQSWHLYNQIL